MKAPGLKVLAITIIVISALALRIFAANVLYIDFDEPVYLNSALKYANYIRTGKVNWLAWETINYEHPVFFKIVYGVALLSQPPVDQIIKSDFDSAQPIQTAKVRTLGLTDRYVSVIFGSISVLVLAILNPLAGLALAIDTLAVRYSSGIFLESLPMLTNLLAVLAYLFWFNRELRQPSKKNFIWLGLSAIFIGISVASKYIYAVTGLAIGFHFVLMVLQKKLKPHYLGYLFLLGIASLLAFFVFDPYLWPHPIARLVKSLSYHLGMPGSDNVVRYDYPFWQSLTWLTAPLSSLIPMTAPALMVRLDQAILFLGLIGLLRLLKKQLLFFIWLVVGVITLLVWPVKWPHYTMLILIPYCFAAGEGAGWLLDQAGKSLGRLFLRSKAI